MFKQFKYNKFNSLLSQWLCSVYSFNKNKLNTLFILKATNDILYNYFNIKPKNTTLKNKNLLNKFTKFSLNKIFVGGSEIKNSLSSINIFVYVFNKEKLILNKKILKLRKKNTTPLAETEIELYTNTNISKTNSLRFNYNLQLYINVFNIIKLYSKTFITNFNNYINKHIIHRINEKIYNKWENKISTRYIEIYIKELEKNKYLDSYTKNKLLQMRNLIKIKYYILFLYKHYLTKLYFNRLKFNNINLFHLSKILYNMFNKPVNINIINLKYLHLDNNMFADAIVKKLKKRKCILLRVLRKALYLSKIPRIDIMFLLEKKEKNSSSKNIKYNICKFNQHLSIININNNIIQSLSHIHMIGIRLEGKGRLTKRLTAARAIYKKAYLGGLKDIYSSVKGLSSASFKGHARSNVNYVNINSYVRNGSYGIKSWHNTM